MAQILSIIGVILIQIFVFNECLGRAAAYSYDSSSRNITHDDIYDAIVALRHIIQEDTEKLIEADERKLKDIARISPPGLNDEQSTKLPNGTIMNNCQLEVLENVKNQSALCRENAENLNAWKNVQQLIPKFTLLEQSVKNNDDLLQNIKQSVNVIQQTLTQIISNQNQREADLIAKFDAKLAEIQPTLKNVDEISDLQNTTSNDVQKIVPKLVFLEQSMKNIEQKVDVKLNSIEGNMQQTKTTIQQQLTNLTASQNKSTADLFAKFDAKFAEIQPTLKNVDEISDLQNNTSNDVQKIVTKLVFLEQSMKKNDDLLKNIEQKVDAKLKSMEGNVQQLTHLTASQNQSKADLIAKFDAKLAEIQPTLKKVDKISDLQNTSLQQTETLINNRLTSVVNQLSVFNSSTNQQLLRIKEDLEKYVNSRTEPISTFVWKITDYNAKFEKARRKEREELMSSPFYTSKFGYKLQANVDLNGYKDGEGTHLSVFIQILPGEYDALLRWPFAQTVSFTLFDQSEKPENITESFVSDPTEKIFQRPNKKDYFDGHGFSKFVSHETLKTRQYVKDDTLFIGVEVK